jgi:hypothetical protein
MPSYHHLTTHVVDAATGEAFEEYKVAQDGNKVECYIESMVGREFKVRVNVNPDFRAVHPLFGVSVHVDGNDLPVE